MLFFLTSVAKDTALSINLQIPQHTFKEAMCFMLKTSPIIFSALK